MYPVLNNKNIKTYSLFERESKVRLSDFGKPFNVSDDFNAFVSSLPNILAAKDLKDVAKAVVGAKKAGKKVVLGMGAHVIKVGLSPIIIDLMKNGIIDAIAMNGASIIHDTEVAIVGHTSEDVTKEIKNGSFGMVKETTEFLIKAVKENDSIGLGEAVGKALCEQNFEYNAFSLLAEAYRQKIPATVHIAIGTDIIHMHPEFDGAAFGRASYQDFLVFSKSVSELDGGCYINLGSAVIMPEVFLKAVSLVRNLGYPLKDITTVNMDFIQHYRPVTNVVRRPTLEGGKGFSLTGHHEIMLPLLCAIIKNYLKDEQNG